MKGFGQTCTPGSAPSTMPSSWRDCLPLQDRPEDLYNRDKLLELYNEVKGYRWMDDSSSSSSASDISPPQPSKLTIPRFKFKALFSTSSPAAKLVKTIKRGAYMTCVFYHKDRILTTEEDRYLPMVEVDDSYSSVSILSDFNWLMKVCCHWEDVQRLKSDMERILSVTSYSFRHQLLTAAVQLQVLMGAHNLGMLHYRLLKDESTGAVVFALVREVKELKHLAIHQNLKWSMVTKLYKNTPPSDSLISSIAELVLYRKACDTRISAGLYLGYLQTEISSSSLKILIPEHSPNTLPHIKIRDNPNVSRNEWQSLLELSAQYEQDEGITPLDNDDVFAFKKEILRSTRRLMDKLNIRSELMAEHRLSYEVVEFSPAISFIILLPPRSQFCGMQTITSHNHLRKITAQASVTSIPLKAFEISHTSVFRNDFMSMYTKAMLLVDMELTAALQSHREAFSDAELDTTKQHVSDMKGYHQTLENAWRQSCWATDVITLARQPSYTGIPMKQLYYSVLNQHEILDRQRRLKSADDRHGEDDNGYHSNRQSLVEPNDATAAAAAAALILDTVNSIQTDIGQITFNHNSSADTNHPSDGHYNEADNSESESEENIINQSDVALDESELEISRLVQFELGVTNVNQTKRTDVEFDQSVLTTLNQLELGDTALGNMEKAPLTTSSDTYRKNLNIFVEGSVEI